MQTIHTPRYCEIGFPGSRCGGKAVLSLADPRTDIRKRCHTGRQLLGLEPPCLPKGCDGNCCKGLRMAAVGDRSHMRRRQICNARSRGRRSTQLQRALWRFDTTETSSVRRSIGSARPRHGDWDLLYWPPHQAHATPVGDFKCKYLGLLHPISVSLMLTAIRSPTWNVAQVYPSSSCTGRPRTIAHGIPYWNLSPRDTALSLLICVITTPNPGRATEEAFQPSNTQMILPSWSRP